MVKFDFKEIEEKKSNSTEVQANFTDGCSGGRSDCCTRVCGRDKCDNDSLNEWDRYLEIEAGVLQY